MKGMKQHFTRRKPEESGLYKQPPIRIIPYFVLCVLATGMLMVAQSGRAQDQVDTKYNWTAAGLAGWTNESPEVALSNPGGYLRMRFQAQSAPYLVSDVMKVPVGPRLWAANISFKFRTDGNPPSAVAVYLRSGTSGNAWHLTLPEPQPGKWVSYNVPVSFSAGWVLGPDNSTVKQFSKDSASVDYVGVYVRRHGSSSAQSYSIDDFRVQGIQTPGGVSIAGTVSYNGELSGPVRVQATSVGGAADTNAIVTIDNPGNYQINGLPALTDYIVSAYRDSNSNNVMDYWEASGVWPNYCASVLLNGFTNINIAMTDPKSTDGVPYWWLKDYLNITNSSSTEGMADADDDHDGMSNYAEYKAGTDPKSKSSVFSIGLEPTNDVPEAPLGVILRWSSIPNRTYSILRSIDLLEAFSNIQQGIASDPPVNVFEDTTATNHGPYYYRIKIE